MKSLNYQIGKLGEKIAKDYLIKKGYQIFQTNFRTRFGEIDLIGGKDNCLSFFEVKLKIGERFGTPEEMITPTKISRLRQMAECFLKENPKIASNYPKQQIEAICIVLDQNLNISRINHWENIEK